MTTPDILFVYVTCGSQDEAKKIGRAVVEEKLAACANIFNGPHAIYPWKGKMEEADEFLLLLKTRAALFDALAARVKSLHSYDVPCIAALPITQINEAYASWILKETEAR
jgi:periplasmic divalent cation tolerance protein